MAQTKNFDSENLGVRVAKSADVVREANNNGGEVNLTIYAALILLEWNRWAKSGKTSKGKTTVRLRSGETIDTTTAARAKIAQVASDPMGFLMAVSNNIVAMLSVHAIQTKEAATDELAKLIPLIESDLSDYATEPTRPELGTMAPSEDGRTINYTSSDGKNRSVSLSGLHRTVTTVYGPMLYVSHGGLALLSLKHGQTLQHSEEPLPEKVNTADAKKWASEIAPERARQAKSVHHAIWQKVESVPELADIARVMLDTDQLADRYVERLGRKNTTTVHDYL